MGLLKKFGTPPKWNIGILEEWNNGFLGNGMIGEWYSSF